MKNKNTLTNVILAAILAIAFYSCSSSDDSNSDLNTNDPSDDRGLRLVVDTLNIKMDNLIFPSELVNQSSPTASGLYRKLLGHRVFVDAFAEFTTIPENTKRTSFETPVELSFTEVHDWEDADGNLMRYTIVENGFTLNYDFKLEMKNTSSEVFETIVDGEVLGFRDTEAYLTFYEGGIEGAWLHFIKNNSETRSAAIVEVGDLRGVLYSDISNGRYTTYIQDVKTDDYIWRDNGREGSYTNPTPFVGGSWMP